MANVILSGGGGGGWREDENIRMMMSVECNEGI